MRIDGLVVCVDYSDYLSRGIEAWRRGLESLTVVTTPNDEQTARTAAAAGAHVVITRTFYRDGAAFNKGGAMDEGLASMGVSAGSAACDWVLFFDADVAPPDGWRAVVDGCDIAPGNLYGAKRRQEDGSPIMDGELAGYFQLWNVRDRNTQQRPLLGDWHNASGYDSAFEARWMPSQRIILPLELVHYGRRGANWCGRGRDDLFGNMIRERHRKGGWQHERLS